MRTEVGVFGFPFVRIGNLFKWVGICLQGGARAVSIGFGEGGGGRGCQRSYQYFP